MHVNYSDVRRAARQAEAAGDAVPTEGMRRAATEVGTSVNGSEASRAFAELADALTPRLAALRTAVTEWAQDVQAAVAAYEESDATTNARLTAMDWR